MNASRPEQKVVLWKETKAHNSKKHPLPFRLQALTPTATMKILLVSALLLLLGWADPPLVAAQLSNSCGMLVVRGVFNGGVRTTTKVSWERGGKIIQTLCI
jgi:hypothetical protein